MVRSPDGNTHFFDSRVGVLQDDTLAPLLCIICLDYVLRTSIDLHSEKALLYIIQKKHTIPFRNNYRCRICI